ncbi:MAG: response regulator [bacterium]
MSNKQKILLVDDEERNLKLLETLLSPQGYEIFKARDGEEAIRSAEEFSPDLILLDVMMPGMDGYEVCVRLRQEFDYLPIIMITALDTRDSRLRGIECGADDFLSKPVDSSELKLKVRNFLRAKSLYDRLEESYKSLKELETVKDNLISFIVHDLRSPLTGIKGYLDLLKKSKNIKGQDLSDVNNAGQNVELMMTLVSNLLDIKRIESNELRINPTVCDLAEMISTAVKTIEPVIIDKAIRLHNEIGGMNIRVNVQKELIERLIQNILSNAARFTLRGGEIKIAYGASDDPNFGVVTISDTGKGIPIEHRGRIFDKFATVEMGGGEGVRRSVGLGLTFCKLAIELHDGKIWVADGEKGGSAFKFTLPLSAKK